MINLQQYRIKRYLAESSLSIHVDQKINHLMKAMQLHIEEKLSRCRKNIIKSFRLDKDDLSYDFLKEAITLISSDINHIISEQKREYAPLEKLAGYIVGEIDHNMAELKSLIQQQLMNVSQQPKQGLRGRIGGLMSKFGPAVRRFAKEEGPGRPKSPYTYGPRSIAQGLQYTPAGMGIEHDDNNRGNWFSKMIGRMMGRNESIRDLAPDQEALLIEQGINIDTTVKDIMDLIDRYTKQIKDIAIGHFQDFHRQYDMKSKPTPDYIHRYIVARGPDEPEGASGQFFVRPDADDKYTTRITTLDPDLHRWGVPSAEDFPEEPSEEEPKPKPKKKRKPKPVAPLEPEELPTAAVTEKEPEEKEEPTTPRPRPMPKSFADISRKPMPPTVEEPVELEGKAAKIWDKVDADTEIPADKKGEIKRALAEDPKEFLGVKSMKVSVPKMYNKIRAMYGLAELERPSKKAAKELSKKIAGQVEEKPEEPEIKETKPSLPEKRMVDVAKIPGELKQITAQLPPAIAKAVNQYHASDITKIKDFDFRKYRGKLEGVMKAFGPSTTTSIIRTYKKDLMDPEIDLQDLRKKITKDLEEPEPETEAGSKRKRDIEAAKGFKSDIQSLFR